MAPGVGVVRQAVRHACEWPVVAVTRSQTQGARAGMVATAILLIALLGWHGNTATTVAAVHYDRAFPELLLRPLSEASRQFGRVQTTRSVGGYDTTMLSTFTASLCVAMPTALPHKQHAASASSVE